MPATDQREAVFARIREALQQPAPHRHAGSSSTDHLAPGVGDEPPEADAFRAWLPAVGAEIEDQLTLLAQNLAGLKADFFLATSIDDLNTQIAGMAATEKWQRVATHRSPLASAAAEKLGLPCLYTDPGYSTAELEQCDAAFTGCDALVVQTGSVLISNKSAGGRALSVLPPHHIVVAERKQVTPDLYTALQLVRRAYAPDWPSFLSFITGPSRTGDIERILVLGAHGPKRLSIFLLP